MGKARVTPLKQIIIPRQELTAAVLAVHVDRMLKIELQIPLMESVFWTDGNPEVHSQRDKKVSYCSDPAGPKYSYCPTDGSMDQSIYQNLNHNGRNIHNKTPDYLLMT
ncbi:hypothetical protein N1851_024542 [Merluccius polli]|uniref:Uncharacterized protein n=1 Tax=Merluccius polli TaxID=89951 RepID=A0AA47MEQ2_MERPO|nr:hypothetical protein N1851_024542 [Merluccius polli]